MYYNPMAGLTFADDMGIFEKKYGYGFDVVLALSMVSACRFC